MLRLVGAVAALQLAVLALWAAPPVAAQQNNSNYQIHPQQGNLSVIVEKYDGNASSINGSLADLINQIDHNVSQIANFSTPLLERKVEIISFSDPSQVLPPSAPIHVSTDFEVSIVPYQ